MKSIQGLLCWVFACSLMTSFASQCQTDGTNAQLQHIVDYVKSVKTAPLIPRAIFNQPHRIDAVKLAPNGQSIAYVLNNDRHKTLWRYSIAQQSHTKLLLAKSIDELTWSADNQAVYYQDDDRIIRTDIHGAKPAHIVYQLDDANTDWLGPDKHNPDINWIRKYLPSTKRYQLLALTNEKAKDKQKVVVELDTPIVGLLTNQLGQLRILQYQIGTTRHIGEYLQGKVQPLYSCEELDPCRLQHWNEQSRVLHLIGYLNQDLLSLFAIDTNSGNHTLIAQDPQQRFDLLRAYFDLNGVPGMVSVRDDYVSYTALSENTQQSLTHITQKLPSRLLRIEPNNNQSVWLVANHNASRGMTEYALYHRQLNQWQYPLAHITQNHFDGETLAPREPFWYTTSDGQAIHGYLTLPLGFDPAGVPLVVFPHGGPWTRSDGRFNSLAQFIANRGYGVFEPNFRASTGYGKDFMTSPNKQFGNSRVQEDIIDGVDFLLQQGIGDADRLAIVGHSFGGFSALTAMAFQPHKFTVAVATAAPSNLTKTMQHFARQMPPSRYATTLPRLEQLMVNIHDKTDIQRLYSMSPDKAWENIVNPIYFWAGENDDRVAVEDIREFALRLQKADKPVSLLHAPNQGHNPEHPVARDAFMYLIETALSAHLGGRADGAMSPALQHYLTRNVAIDELGLAAFKHAKQAH